MGTASNIWSFCPESPPVIHRRSLATSLLPLLMAAVGMAGAQESLWTNHPAGVDWPGFLGPDQNGKSSETGILTDWSGDRLKVLWSAEVGEGYSIGSVAAGRYVHFDRANGEARIRCFNAETGEPIWEHRYPSEYDDLYGYDSGPRTSPVIEGDRVYTLGVEGQLSCLGLSDGQLHWQVDTVKRFGVIQNFFGVGSSPVVVGDLLLVMVGGSPEASKLIAPGQLDRVLPNGSAVVAFDRKTGDVRYQTGDDLASYATIRVPDPEAKDPLALAFCRNGLVAFRAVSGTVTARFPWRARILESVNAATPVVSGDQVLLSECYGPGSVLLDLDGDAPREIWSDARRRDKALLAHWATPILHDGYVYGCSGRNTGDADLRCVELATGKIRWREPNTKRCSLTWVDGHLIVLGEYGQLSLIRCTPEGYERVTEVDFDSHPNAEIPRFPAWSAPILSHGLMWVRGSRQVTCFELIPAESR